MKKILNNNKGFTLIELLCAITILSVIAGIAIILSIGAIRQAKEKTYEATIANIEHNASIYVTENNDKIFYITDTDNELEYQCVSVGNLIDMGYLNPKATNSPISDSENVSRDDYIRIDRNPKSKAIIRTVYDKIYNDTCDYATKAAADISFKVEPDITKWSTSKDVTITYRIRNNSIPITSTKEYKITGTTYGEYTGPIHLEENTIISAKIADVERLLMITTIDRLGPTINCVGAICGSTIPTPQINSNDSVSITLGLQDEGSGVNLATVTKSDFIVKLYNPGTNTFTDIYNFEFTKSAGNVTITITDSIKTGYVYFEVPADRIEDYAGNKNVEIKMYTNKTLNMAYELLTNSTTHNKYVGTLEKAFNQVSPNGTVKALVDNTSTSIATNTKSNITLNTNGKTITLSAQLRNNGNLTINGNGIIAGNTGINNLGSGTLTTQSTTINLGISNRGNTIIDSGTIVHGTIGAYNNTVTVKSGASIISESNGISRTSTVEENDVVTINIEGGVINAGKYGIGVSCGDDDRLTMTNINVYGGTITGSSYGIKVWGCANRTTITAGTIIGKTLQGVSLTAETTQSGEIIDACNGTNTYTDGGACRSLTIGTQDGNVNNTPKIYSQNSYAVGVVSGPFYWYDGELYGNNGHSNQPDSQQFYAQHVAIYENACVPINESTPTTYNGTTYRYKSYLIPSGQQTP